MELNHELIEQNMRRKSLSFYALTALMHALKYRYSNSQDPPANTNIAFGVITNMAADQQALVDLIKAGEIIVDKGRFHIVNYDKYVRNGRPIQAVFPP